MLIHRNNRFSNTCRPVRVAAVRPMRARASRATRLMWLAGLLFHTLDASAADGGATADLGPGYVRSITVETRTRLYWARTNRVKLVPHTAGSDGITDGSDLKALQLAAARWNRATEACSYLKLEVLPPDPDVVVELNKTGLNESIIIWRESGWPHDPQAAGITTVSFVDSAGHPEDGRILDTDIELNGNLQFSTSGAANSHDVQNTAVHEMGHVMGLDHPCDDGLRNPVPPDNFDRPLPNCFPLQSLSPTIRQMTMFNFALAGETHKATPEPLDIAGICAAYPLAEDPKLYTIIDLTPPPGCGSCTVSAGDPPHGLLWLASLLLLCALRRRQRRSGHPREPGSLQPRISDH